MPERDPIRSQGDLVIDVEAGDGGPWAFRSYRTQTPFTVTADGDFVVRTGESERLRITSEGAVSGVGAMSLGWFNVKDPVYGARGDDATDDTAAIQGAISSCEAAGGGIVYFPPGTYKTTAPLLVTADKVWLRGSGRSTPINPPSGTEGPTVISPSAAFVGSAVINISESSLARSLRACRVSDLSISGFSLSSGVDGIYSEINSSVIENLWIAGVTGAGIHLKGYSTDGCFNSIYRNYIESIDGDAFVFDTDAPDNLLTENTTFAIGGNGVNCISPGIKIQGNHLLDITGKAITGNIYDTKVYGNRIEDCNGGVYLSGALGFGGFSIVGNKIWNCSIAADNTTDSINISASSTALHGGVISGNDFYTNVGAANGGTSGHRNRARYHVNITGSLVNDVVIGTNSYLGFNDALSSYGTAAINDDGTRTQVTPIVLARSGVASSHTGDTSETALASITVPGGLMGKKGRLLVRTLWSIPNNANTKAMRVRLGGITGSQFLEISLTTSLTLNAETVLWNRGVQNSQVAQSNFTIGPGSTNNSVFTAAVDTSADQVLAITAACGVSTDTITLEAYSVELIQ